MIVGVEVNRMTETQITTPLGDLWVSCSGGNRVYADANSNGKPGLRLRGGGTFHVTFSIERQADGSWQVEGDIYTSRAWSPTHKGSFDHATRHQVEDIRKKVVPVVIEWAKGQEKALAEAGLQQAEWKHEQAEKAVAELREKLTNAESLVRVTGKLLDVARKSAAFWQELEDIDRR